MCLGDANSNQTEYLPELNCFIICETDPIFFEIPDMNWELV